MGKQLVLVAAILIAATVAVSAQSKESLTSYYDSKIVNFNYDLWQGITLTYRGQNYQTQFGLAPTVRGVLSQFPDTKELVDTYSKRNLTGNALLWGGLAVVLGSTIYPIYYETTTGVSTFQPTPGYWVSLGAAGIGAVVEIVGAFIYSSGFQSLTHAVNAYNRHEISRY